MRNRKRKTGIVGMISFLALLILSCMSVSAGIQEGDGKYEIYPTPQEAVYGQGEISLTDEIGVTVGKTVGKTIDMYTVQRIDETLKILNLSKKEGKQTGKTNLTVGIYGSGDEADVYAKANGADAAFFDKQDAYMLFAKGGQIVIVGKNTDAAFYGVTTLKRIFQQITNKKMKELTIKDYSDIQFRGFIEGYYGNPWSIEDRIELMKFGGELKMNQYIFAPKDDPYHNSKWRDPYPEADLEQIKRLAVAGNESKCFFVWSIHCFMRDPFRFNTEANYQADLNVIKTKFTQLLKVGVRQFGVLADDAGAVSPENTVKLLNDLDQWIGEQQKTYPDLRRDILYCPNDYMGNGESAQLKGINKVNRNVHIMATGGRIWGEVTPTFGSNYFKNIASTGNEGRAPYMWINWPCTDNSKNHLIMGGQNTFLHAGVKGSDYKGIVLNPMQQSEPSKTAIFMNSDFSWKCWKDAAEGDQAWDDAFKYVDHVSAVDSKEAAALREMSRHMINQAMDGRVRALEESVELAPKLAEFTAALQAGGNLQAAVDKIKPEFQVLNDAAKLYLSQGKNERLVKQATPFFSCMRDITQANLNLLNAVEGILKKDDNAVWENFSQAQTAYGASKSYGYTYVNEIKYAEVGNQHIVPFTNKLMKYVSDAVQQILDPEHIKLEETLIYEVGGSSATSNLNGSLSAATDGNLGTSVEIKRNQKPGDYVGLTFNAPVSVSNIRVALWKADAPKNFFYAGKMQYTTDGKVWVDFAADVQPKVTGDAAHTVEMNFKEMEIKGFRWVCTDLGGADRWVVIRDIGYNIGESAGTKEEKYTGTLSYSNTWSLASGSGQIANLTDGNDATNVWFKTSGDTSEAGDYLQLDLGSEKAVGRVRVLVGADTADKWKQYHVEYSGDASKWTKLESSTGADNGVDTYIVNLKGVKARYIRVVNDQKRNKWVKFSEFSVFSYVEGMDHVPMDYTNTSGQNWMVNYEEESAKIIPKSGAVLKPGQYIGLRLDRIHAIKKITAEGKGTDKLTLESGMNESEMQTGTAKAARYIRLINKTSSDVSLDLSSFMVETDEIQQMDLLESTMGIHTQYGDSDARKTGTTKNWMDQDLNSRAIYSDYPKKDDTIVYSLGQEIKLKSLKVYVLDTEIDYPRDAVIEVSGDNKNWTSVLTIGDGVENNGSDKDTKPVDNGWIHDTVDPAFAYLEKKGLDVSAKYLRMRMTANYNSRFVALNEIRINDGAYISTINDPTFETNAAFSKGYEPQNLNDRDLTSSFKSDSTSGSLVYHLSEATKAGKINIVQTGISHAEVSVRVGKDLWVKVGTLDKSLNTFYTFTYDYVLDIKIEWKNAKPEINEIIVLQNPGDTTGKIPVPIPTPTPDPTPAPTPGPDPVIKPNPETVTSTEYKNISYEVLNPSSKTVVAAASKNKNAKTVVIPATVKIGETTYKVTQINARAFKGNKKLTKITIGKNVKKIGKEAFAQCTKLKSINMKSSKNITSIGKKAFQKVHAKATVTVPKTKFSKYKRMLKKAGLSKTVKLKKA